MELLNASENSVDIRLSREEATGLYQLLVEAEAWPRQAVGARPFIRQVREQLSAAVEGFRHQR